MKKGAHTTIIKRGGKKANHGVHTGAWKVAFADFTLAMMALFMVLWIVSSVSKDERREIVAQLNGVSLFGGGAFSPLNDPSSGSNSLPIAPPVPAIVDTKEATETEESQQTESLKDVLSRSDRELNELSEAITKIIAELNAQGNLSLEKVPQGLRILLQDDNDRLMFPRGSARMTHFFTRLLSELAPVFNRIDNQVVINGHTDSANYRNNAGYNNWNLSGDRALAARSVLEKGGLEARRVIQVNAMADRMLLDPDNPLAARNRRIEIMVLTQAASDSLYQFYGRDGVKVVKPIIDRLQ
ncbi:putative lateral flagellar export/assembly protein LafU [Erwinia sorbitola]|uniref:Lateral flagellar export/assembly protein LafU n=1 Tax=Erwinia sorbitola TaxID=2681984 RepID=A0A6I6EVZ1_9GAMM|nr:putative lateral flagellar export/assembly protein LafU [Erwinia sorbitola]MTD26939.1 putative lateral flagellar export/assembly protein LafU [Erwinia sorbitola]QGU88503.1 putative lateral flagellar export/assembly protein LafU [Erwinia sorbitola]